MMQGLMGGLRGAQQSYAPGSLGQDDPTAALQRQAMQGQNFGALAQGIGGYAQSPQGQQAQQVQNAEEPPPFTAMMRAGGADQAGRPQPAMQGMLGRAGGPAPQMPEYGQVMAQRERAAMRQKPMAQAGQQNALAQAQAQAQGPTAAMAPPPAPSGIEASRQQARLQRQSMKAQALRDPAQAPTAAMMF
jgi:hypothetical protein